MINEKRLVLQAKRDPEGFLKLYDHYQPKLYAYVLSRARHKETAEDVVQQTFVKALDKIDTFKYKKSATFGSWLFRIARNEMIDSGKKGARIRLVEEVEEVEGVEGVEEVEEIQFKIDIDRKLNTVLEALDRLDSAEKEIVSLKYFSELSYKEISAITGKKPNTLAVTIRRALKKIRLDLDVWTNLNH